MMLCPSCRIPKLKSILIWKLQICCFSGCTDTFISIFLAQVEGRDVYSPRQVLFHQVLSEDHHGVLQVLHERRDGLQERYMD